MASAPPTVAIEIASRRVTVVEVASVVNQGSMEAVEDTYVAPRSRVMWFLWATVVLVAGPSFLYYLNGWVQFGMRHALDFEPFMLVLMALALRERERIPLWATVLVTWSCLAGVWGAWYWDTFVRTGN